MFAQNLKKAITVYPKTNQPKQTFMKKIYFFLLTILSTSTFAQDYDFTIYNTENSGIGFNQVTDIRIDNSQTLWLVSNYNSGSNGISKFDGTTWTNYNTNNSGIQTNLITDLEIDGLNKKWLGTWENGIVVYNGTTWINYTTTNSGLPSNNINDIAIDGLNNIWIGTPAGLTKFNGTTWVTYNTTNSNIYSNNIQSIGISSNNVVYTADGTVLQKLSGTTFTIVTDGAKRIEKIVGNTIYLNIYSGYAKLVNEDWTEGYLYSANNSCLLDCQLEAFDIDENNDVWLGFYSECNGGGVQNFTDCENYTSTNTGGIPLSYIAAMKVQSSNTIWIGTLEGGLIKMSLGNATPTCFEKISSGQQFNVAIKSDGTMWSWGANAFDQLGYETTSNINVPTQIGTDNDWATVSCGSAHTLAIKTNGTLWAWGNNVYGYLGDGTNVPKVTPTQIGTANNWQSVCAGSLHSFGIKTNGTLWAWGYNVYGQLGDGTNSNRNVPTQIGTATNWASIGAGDSHSIGIKTTGTLFSWGRNDKGQLGDGTTTNSNTPMQIGSATNWRNADAGISYTIATKTNGTLYTWGQNTVGQLGQNDLVNRSMPTQVGTATTWSLASAGGSHVVASKTDGALFAWGNNSSGQIGNSSTTNTLVPTSLFAESGGWITVNAGFDFSSALSANSGSVSTWGNGSLGQLGNGTYTNDNNANGSLACPTSLSIDDLVAYDINLYPNPVQNSFKIENANLLPSIKIYDMKGAVAKVITANFDGVIDISDLQTGIYLVKIEDNEGRFFSKRLIKE